MIRTRKHVFPNYIYTYIMHVFFGSSITEFLYYNCIYMILDRSSFWLQGKGGSKLKKAHYIWLTTPSIFGLVNLSFHSQLHENQASLGKIFDLFIVFTLYIPHIYSRRTRRRVHNEAGHILFEKPLWSHNVLCLELKE